MLIAFALLFLGTPAVSMPAEYSIYASCSEDESPIQKIGSGDQVQVTSSVAGSEKSCYSVTVTSGGKAVRGYLLGEGHPAIEAFDAERRAAKAFMPPPPPKAVEPAKEGAPAAPAPPPSYFDDFSARDWQGKPVHLADLGGKAILVNFWASTSREGKKQMDEVAHLYYTYNSRGLKIVSVNLDRKLEDFQNYVADMEAPWPQIADHAGTQRALAAKYHVDSPSKVFLLDSKTRQIIGVDLKNSDLEKAVDKITRQ